MSRSRARLQVLRELTQKRLEQIAQQEQVKKGTQESLKPSKGGHSRYPLRYNPVDKRHGNYYTNKR